MTPLDRNAREQRVLVLAPTGKDAHLTQSVLERAGITCHCCEDLVDACRELDAGAAALLLAEEAITTDDKDCLSEWLSRQPPWSDLPLLILARPGIESATVMRALDLLGNVSVLERPTRVAALVSIVRTALRSRQRQYQARDRLGEHVQRGRDLQEANSRLRASEQRFRLMADAVPVLIWVSDLTKGCTWFNKCWRDFSGRPLEELLGDGWARDVHPDDFDRCMTTYSTHFDNRQPFSMEYRLRRHDGEYRWILDEGIPRFEGDGTFVGYIGACVDLTQRKQAERALRDADRRKDEFLAVLAHELRNPLAPIRNSLNILRMSGQLDPMAERVGEMMERQVNHMVRLVDDLMEVSRITRGKIELRKELIEIAAVVRSAVETSRPLIDAAGHQLALAVPAEPITIEGDLVRLSQVFANLLNNAAKYTDPGGQIWLSVSLEPLQVALSVRDTGAGIPSEMLPHVFDLFTQVDRNANRAQGGLGIGLALVKSIVELHGGSVEGRSAGVGCGSEFVVRLPRAVLRQSAGIPGKQTGKQPPLPRRRVLVVDDNKDAADSLAMLLKLIGVDVCVVYSGAEALKAWSSFRPEVVLLDIGMPGMDGHEVARRLRSDPQSGSATLIALTGWGQEEDRRRSEKSGFDHHLVKPPEIATLKTLLLSLSAPPTSAKS